MMIKLTGWQVLRTWRGSVYVRIPRELAQPCGTCQCKYCKEHPNEIPQWDTLGIPINPTGTPARDAYTWTLHAPEWTPNDRPIDAENLGETKTRDPFDMPSERRRGVKP